MPGKEPGVKLKSLDGGEVPKSSRLADEAGEAVAEGAVAGEEGRAPFASQGKERAGSCLRLSSISRGPKMSCSWSKTGDSGGKESRG
jgi:hypothetical protein